MQERLQACSRYCEHKKGKLYLPCDNGLEETFRYTQKCISIIKKCLAATKGGSFVYNILKKFYHSAPFSALFHYRYYSNNNLGIYITTSCSLSCFNCQTSARQAPANDIMTVGQVEKLVNEAINLKYYWNKIFLTGGESTLHPQLFEIIDLLKQYKDFNPECAIYLETNGVGDRVQSILNKLPGWILVLNSHKSKGRDSYAFFPYHVAPIDIPAYRFSDFSKGCSRLSACYGLCATMYGYYACAPCVNVARVFGFDVGIEKLSLVSEKALRKQLKILCKYCGWFREQQNETVLVEKKSRSWERAFAEYNKQKPKLRSL